MAKSKKTSDAFDMADDIRKEVAAESVADACSTSVPAIYSLAKGDNPRRAKYDKNADVIGYNLRLPANIHRLLKRHCMETNESMNNVVLVALYRDMKNWEDLCSLPALRRYSSCRCAVLPGLRQGDLEVGEEEDVLTILLKKRGVDEGCKS